MGKKKAVLFCKKEPKNFYTSEHSPSGFPRAYNPAFQGTPIEGGVLRLAWHPAGNHLPDAIGMEQAQVRGRPLRQGASTHAEHACRPGGQQLDRLHQPELA
jgi:hypothetical protein